MIVPGRSVSNYDSSLKLTIFANKDQFFGEETLKCISPVLSSEKQKTPNNDFPLKKLFKCGTEENFGIKPNESSIVCKENLYLSDTVTIKNFFMPQTHSTNNLQTLNENIESIGNISTINKFEVLMTETQKKISKFTTSKFELEFPNEADTREVLTEDNALKLLKKLFHQNYLFWNVDEQNIKNALPYIFLKKFKSQSIILSESEIPYNFFIIQSGIVVKKSMKNSVSAVKYLDKGKMFAEKSLFDQMKRTSTYMAEGNCLLWGINIATFFKLLSTSNRDNYNENRKFLNKVSIFKVIDNYMKDQIALNLYEQKFQKSECILDTSSICACCFLLKKGELVLKNTQQKIEKVFHSGDYIGDWSLNSFFFPNLLEVSSKEEATLLVISNKNLRSILGDNLYSLNWKNLSRLAFSQSQLFSRLSSETIEKIIDNLEISCYEKNQVICRKGSEIDSLYIALDGNLRKTSIDTPIEEPIIGEECSLFGEPFLLRKQSLKRDESIVIDNNGIIGEISKTNIERIIGMKFGEILSKDQNLNILKRPSEEEKANEEIMDKNDIEVLELAGDGQFGLVFLIRYKDEFFALKICAKAYIISRRFELYLINEKLIQNSLGDFPFLIKFHRSFKDENLVFFLMDYVNGKDLSTLFYSQQAPFSSDIARFYIAQLILTIEYLHSKKIVHRDIKLNNILVDQYGYIKLIDFGIAKFLTSNRTFTIVGTPHYMAPEIIMGKGYDYSVDYWAIGICLFEMLFGRLPFGDNTEDPIEVYSQIISSKLVIEKKRLMDLSNGTNGTIDFIQKILNKDASKRINPKEVKEHPWYNGFDWDKLLKKEMITFHAGKEKNLQNIKGKKLVEYLEMEEIQNYLKKEETKLSKIHNWDDIF